MPAYPALIDLRSLTLAGGESNRWDGTLASQLGARIGPAGDVNGDGYDDAVLQTSYRSYVVFGTPGGAGNIDPALPTARSWQFSSSTPFSSIAGVGDVNGDGFADLVVGTENEGNNGRSDSGSAYLIFGRAGAGGTLSFPAIGAAGIRIDGAARNNLLGHDVAAAGDVNGDGYGDFLLSAYNGGFAYLLFGKATGFANMDLASLAPDAGIRLSGPRNEFLGASVAGAGDVNGDGFADILVSAPNQGSGALSFRGATYLIYGKATGLASSSSLDFLAGTARIDGASGFDSSGSEVAAAGDVNGDGYGDILITAPGTDYNGRPMSGSAYLLFGRSENLGTIDLRSLETASPLGFRIDGPSANEGSFVRAAAAGDVDGDGFADILLGWPQADSSGRTDNGSAFLLHGKAAGFGNIDLANPTGLVRIDGAATGDTAGIGVASAGDTNADGFADILIGAQGADNGSRSDSGSVYTLFSQQTGGANGRGTSLADQLAGGSAGDTLNGAGGDDTLQGRGGDDRLDGGAGRDTSSYLNAAAGVIVRLTLQGAAQDTGGAGNDLLLGIENLRGSGFADTMAGDGADNRIRGEGGDDILFALSGQDSLEGGDGADILYGGSGNDLMAGGSGDDSYLVEDAGDVVREMVGEGRDSVFVTAASWTVTSDQLEVVYLAGQGFALRGGAADDTLVSNPTTGSEVAGAAGSDTLWGQVGADTLLGDDGADIMRGGGGDDLLDGGAGNDQLVGGAGADRFVISNTGWGFDQIFDFTRPDGDRISFLGSGIASFDLLSVRDEGGDSIVAYGASRIDVYGVTGLTQGDFIFG